MLVGLPVSGSVADGMPFLPMNGPTPKFWCVVYFVLATGLGRRYTEMVGVALFSPYRASVSQQPAQREQDFRLVVHQQDRVLVRRLHRRSPFVRSQEPGVRIIGY